MTSFEENVSDIYEKEIADTDFGFIIDSSGELKTVFFPEDYSGLMPKKIKEVLYLMGVDDPDSLAGITLH
jgi:5'-3' exonuclease